MYTLGKKLQIYHQIDTGGNYQTVIIKPDILLYMPPDFIVNEDEAIKSVLKETLRERTQLRNTVIPVIHDIGHRYHKGELTPKETLVMMYNAIKSHSAKDNELLGSAYNNIMFRIKAYEFAVKRRKQGDNGIFTPLVEWIKTHTVEHLLDSSIYIILAPDPETTVNKEVLQMMGDKGILFMDDKKKRLVELMQALEERGWTHAQDKNVRFEDALWIDNVLDMVVFDIKKWKRQIEEYQAMDIISFI